jgi:hypothetical protein
MKQEELDYCGLYSQAKEKLDKIDKNILLMSYAEPKKADMPSQGRASPFQSPTDFERARYITEQILL